MYIHSGSGGSYIAGTGRAMYCDGTVSTSCAMEMDLPGYRRPKDEMQTFEDKGVGSGATLVSPKKKY